MRPNFTLHLPLRRAARSLGGRALLRPRHNPYCLYYILFHPMRLSAMDARALRYFHAGVEFGSYSRASEYLRTSQPAISRQVDRLEQELGKPLFVRNSLGATPTDAGRLLFERSQPILRQLEDAKAEIKSAAGASTGTIVIAIP